MIATPTIAAPSLRIATLDDYDRIAELESANDLGSMPLEDWRHLWIDNPLWPRVADTWPIGWLLEDFDGRLVGSVVNIPTRYTFQGHELICANGRGWVVDPAFRGYALMVMDEYFHQPGADLFINTTVASNAEAKIGAFAERVPSGDFQTVAYWVTGYRGFARKALQKLGVPGADLLAWPAAAALWLKDALTSAALPTRYAGVCIEHIDAFDERFDRFWDAQVRANPEKLLSTRDRCTLTWHFGNAQRAGRLWIVTVTRSDLLRAYAIFRRQDRGDGVRRMQLVDFQTLEPEVDLLAPMLQSALERSRRERLYVLEQVGYGLANRRCFDCHAPYRRRLPCWPYYYRATNPELGQALLNPAAWEPSMFDGDGSLD